MCSSARRGLLSGDGCSVLGFVFISSDVILWSIYLECGGMREVVEYGEVVARSCRYAEDMLTF